MAIHRIDYLLTSSCTALLEIWDCHKFEIINTILGIYEIKINNNRAYHNNFSINHNKSHKSLLYVLFLYLKYFTRYYIRLFTALLNI